jgi:hypothetical protein
MAGKTLTGIGEDETGKLELPDDEPPANEAPSGEAPPSAQLAADDKAKEPEKEKPPARATDRMPLSFGPLTKSGDRVPLSTIIGAPIPILSPEPSVDEDKVAEGLKKLRSLDEPLGAIPTSMPTVKELPAVVEPSAVTPATDAAAAASELSRSRGTAHGHAISPDLLVEIVGPVSADDRMKGTLLGHMLHLPDDPSPGAEGPKRTAEVREIARVAAPRTTLLIPPPEADQAAPDFSRGEARSFDATPINDELTQENPRSKMVARGAIFLAVTSIFVVAAIAWVRAGKTDSTVIEHPVPPIEPGALENAAPPAPTPPPAPSEPAGTAAGQGAAPSAPAPAASAPVAAPPPAPPAAAAPPPAAPAPKLEEAKPAAPAARAKPRHHEATAPAPTASPAAKPGPPPPHETTKPAVPAKPGKAQEDPDGTLPLTE